VPGRGSRDGPPAPRSVKGAWLSCAYEVRPVCSGANMPKLLIAVVDKASGLDLSCCSQSISGLQVENALESVLNLLFLTFAKVVREPTGCTRGRSGCRSTG
jgi:hypothetical protein